MRENHGLSRTPIYRVWAAMVRRCTNPRAPDYRHYGGRGITICTQWRESFTTFYCDMGLTYRHGLTLERTDNNGPYSPGNCRWASRAEQARNNRNCRRIMFRGRTQMLSDWARDLGLPLVTLHSRIGKLGWTLEKALTTPTRHRERMITVNGESHSISEWARISGVPNHVITKRIDNLGWEAHDAIWVAHDFGTAEGAQVTNKLVL